MQSRTRHFGSLTVLGSALLLAGIHGTGCDGSSECAGMDGGDLVCMEALVTEDDWQRMSQPTQRVDQVRTSKYLVPARSDARLPALLMNVNLYATHWQFLREGFPERFGMLSDIEYEAMILEPAHREFFAGSITEYLVPGGSRIFGFVVWDRQMPEGTASCAELTRVYRAMARAVDIGPVAVVPTTRWQRTVLAHCNVPSYDPATVVAYEAYHTGYAYGTLRRFTLTELPVATASGAFGWRDILVLEEAPFDVETVIAGSVTGSRQGELSHLNVRSAARGTPNCYLQNAYELLARYEGQLVRLDCNRREVQVVPATLEQAQPWWDAFRPAPVAVPAPDWTWTEMVDLHHLPTATAADRARGVARFGAKGANLATLYQRIPPEHQLDGFLVPFHYYDAFLHAGRWTVDLGRGAEQLTFAETIERYLDDPLFHMDMARRRNLLNGLRAAMRATRCDPALLEALAARIQAVFGSHTVMVRFRSSSNAEDGLHFSGAGLYSSASACAADDLDGDQVGPSRCDPTKSKERGMCRALTEVWASLWKPQAFEEREWYGIDHRSVGMAILVNTRSGDEQANAVAFTGVPDGDPRIASRYLINAQLGEADVVTPAPGTWPEKALLTVDEGQVLEIERIRGSSLLPGTGYVLDDDQLDLLGTLLWDMVALYPIDDPVPPSRRVLLDTEWKVLSSGRLIIKQVRPFLD